MLFIIINYRKLSKQIQAKASEIRVSIKCVLFIKIPQATAVKLINY